MVKPVETFTTWLLGFDPASMILLEKKINEHLYKWKKRTVAYPIGVKEAVEWYILAILVVGMPLLLIR